MNKLIIAALIVATSSSVMANTFSWKEPQLNFESDRQVALTKINNASELAGGLERMIEDSKGRDSVAKFNVSQMYLHGIKFDKDIEKGIKLLKESADLGYSLAQVQYGKLLMHLYPSVSEKDIQKNNFEGIKYISEAAYNNVGEAQYILGSSYAVGELVPEDRDMAMFWLSKSSDNGYAPALKTREEFVIERNKNKQSFEYVQSRAINGNKEYLVELAKFYQDGWVVQRDESKAIRLLKSAANLGSQNAKDKLDELGISK